MRIRGFTFIEIVVALLIVGIALVTLSGLISRDMKTTTQNRWDEIAQAAAAAEVEYHARVVGFNGLDPLASQPTTVPLPMNPPDQIPWGQIRRYVQRHTRYPTQSGNNPNPEVLLLTVYVDIAESYAAYTQGKGHTWKATTLVVRNGFDKDG